MEANRFDSKALLSSRGTIISAGGVQVEWMKMQTSSQKFGNTDGGRESGRRPSSDPCEVRVVHSASYMYLSVSEDL